MEQKIINLIYQAINPENNTVISIDTPFSELPYDSIKFLKMVVALEREFNFEFDDDKLLIKQFPTVRSVIKYVYLKVGLADK